MGGYILYGTTKRVIRGILGVETIAHVQSVTFEVSTAQGICFRPVFNSKHLILEGQSKPTG